MVATLVKLRWRLTINSLRGVWWKILLEAWLFLNLFAFLAFAIGGLIALGMLGWRYTPQVLSVLVTLTVTGWLIFPLLITGADNSLEPRQLRLWVVPSRKLAAGLIVAAGWARNYYRPGATNHGYYLAVTRQRSGSGICPSQYGAGLANCSDRL